MSDTSSAVSHRYTGELAATIEARWQKYWREHGAFHTANPVGSLSAQGDVDRQAVAEKPKFYVLDMFIGPSGTMHVGHPLGYVATDVYGRYLRMRGHQVLHAFGYDAFGLPAEQYAVQTGQHPRITTEENIATIAGQLRRLGLAHDERRTVATTDVGFYRWTQWIFLKIFHAWYDTKQDRARPIADLVAAFESGERATPDGRPWSTLTEGERRRLIDAHRLAYLDDVTVNWCPGLGTVLANEEVTAEGRSERGNFPVYPRTMRQWMLRITAYAHRLLADLDLLDWPESIKAQQRNWIGRSETVPNEGEGEGEAGKGTLTYQLRDWVFSRQRYWGEPFPIVYDEHGPVALPESMLPVVLPETTDFAPRTYDPEDAGSEPEAPLARLREWVSVRLDLGDGPKDYRRETHTMPQWAGSCWYELRYLDPTNDEAFCDPANERYWMGPQGDLDGGGVDLYVGGVEHAVLHLLYARFWHKVLHDLGYVSSREPFRRLVNNGYIQAYSYTDARGVYVPAAEVEERDGGYYWRGELVRRSLGKMGKSLRNMVTPDEMCDEYGADTFRVYVMSTGPLHASRPWDPHGIVGAHRFLQRVWRALVDEESGALRVTDSPADDATRRLLHKTIDAVRQDLDDLAFNTAIARLMELVRGVVAFEAVPREVAGPLVLLLAPFAPHLAEELWSRLGSADSLAYLPYPQADPAYLTEDLVTCVVQVAGRVRDRLEVPAAIAEEALRQRALASEKVRAALAGRGVRTVIVRAPRLVNVVPG
ncbi:class I tRNA ligase family protein [Actinopolymorpha alba]|uniref:class I tRNA ligase family protein n=1 Tax=Actinopolymorpha alba TaxID=533267 RepID=UPI0003753A07|nr:class I tRNA ligase family protein [Actinopolymorpha alba]